MKARMLLCWSLLCCNALYADIYTWTDERGVVHFSDTPAPGAKPVQLPAAQSQTSPPPSVVTELPKMQGVKQPTALAYDAVSIVEPKPDLTFRNPQGTVSVQVDVKPALNKGDLLQVLLDGTVMSQPQENGSFALSSINRGKHALTAQIIDGKGNVLKTSDPVTIYMMQPRVGMSGSHSP